MPPTPLEQQHLLSPLQPDSLAHNTRQLSNIRSLTSLLLGIAAGVLGLQSLPGFAFYFGAQFLVSSLFYFICAEGKPEYYFNEVSSARVVGKAVREIWLGGGLGTEGLSGFVLGWAGVGGVIR